MSDRSDEVTTNRDARSTDDLLEETDRLLGDDGSSERGDRTVDDPTEFGSASETQSWRESSEPRESASASGSRLRSLGSRLSPSAYFSPTAFLVLVAVLGAGLLAGSVAIPIGGRTVGMAAVAFLVGLVGSKRRYLEMGVAGVAVGGVAAVLNHAVLAIAGSGEAVAAVGAGAGLLVCLLAYYFGRDLRDGLVRDVE
ncbi:DUF5336 domain-containing protein [Natrialbaceae archaeon AArc-T1-2]|uniref:DUF5336 domain-containing protein n=1 Tax=Natrialbaceae archaeon AArc-T1-2 TaxID=3053904 RepID=UPI00255B22D5|nr:DUF456 domain-containing protein [Natrialbaceae archaeon AArc-T1-2]WIV65727.1 DUF456 domain-containing protein [Natrialbaceae archaeon AArc-T1-2]